MLKNYFISIIRNLRHRKFYAIINITSLSIGICSVILIYMILSYEFSFDKYQPDYKNTYRVVMKVDEFGKTNYTPAVSYPIPPFLKDNFPEFKYCAIIDANFGTVELTVNNSGTINRYQEEKGIAYVGNDFFKIFKYNWLRGNEDISVNKENAVILSESAAQKYFGKVDPIGKTLLVFNKYPLEVTGIVKDPPANTEFPLRIIIPYDHFDAKMSSKNWTSLSAAIQCIVTLKAGTNVNELVKKINIQTQKRMNSDGEVYSIFLQPLSEVHFDERFYSISESTITKEKLFGLGIIGLLILLISCINYINLNTALLSKNSVEIGIRKVLGGSRKQIFFLFILNTISVSVISFMAAAIYLELAVPKIESLTGFSLKLSSIDPVQFILFLLITLIFIVLLGGGYPALIMSKFAPIKVIKQNLNMTTKRSAFSLRKILVILQFGISQALIIATSIVLFQIHFVKSADMGFNKKSLLEVPLPIRDSIKIAILKEQLLNNTFVRNVSFSSTGAASNNRWRGTCKITTESEIKNLNPIIKFIDHDFINTYGVKLLAGENIRDNSGDNRFLVNQEFIKEVGLKKNYDKAIGISLHIWGVKGTVAGIVKDFNATSLHDKIEPMVMTSARKIFNQAGIKLAPGDKQKQLKKVKSIWTSIYPEHIFDYDFVDQLVNSFYDKDANVLSFLYLFSGLAILLACLGLFGLVSFLTLNRTKEVGIRKVLGASISSLLKLLSKDFLVLVLFASLISWPAAYYFMNKWLEDYAYRINISVVFFFFATALSITIAFLTMIYQTLKVANTNPVKSLRYE